MENLNGVEVSANVTVDNRVAILVPLPIYDLMVEIAKEKECDVLTVIKTVLKAGLVIAQFDRVNIDDKEVLVY